MKKKNIFLFIVLVVVAIVGSILFNRFAQWYSQVLGSIFSYIVIISFILLIFTPFKLMKDKQAKISLVSYVKYFGCTFICIGKILAKLIKESVLTIIYIISKFFSKETIKKTVDQ